MPNAWGGADPAQAADADDYELGVEYRANADITITHVRIWSGAGEESITNRRARIWSTAGSQQALITLPDDLADGWSSHALDTPLEKTAGSRFVVSYMTGGNYGFLNNALDSDVASGDGNVTALSAANATNGNGVFNLTPGSFPATGPGTHPFYGTDFTYTVGIGGNTAPRITDTSVIASGLTVTAALTVEDDQTLVGASTRIKWGDGTSDTVINYPTLTAPHTYAAAGIYPVLFTLSDAGGLSDNEADYAQVFAADSTVNTLDAKAMQQALASHAMKLGQFKAPISLHEPRVRPASELHAALWLNGITPIRASGLSTVSARVEWLFRMYTPGEQEPQDEIDAKVLTATDRFLSSLCGDFDLDDLLSDDLVRMIDILGAYGTGLNAAAGWARWSDGQSRVVTITIPVIVNDLWQEA